MRMDVMRKQTLKSPFSLWLKRSAHRNSQTLLLKRNSLVNSKVSLFEGTLHLLIAFTLPFLAFICLLTISGTMSHIGALTDGKSWRFYYIVQNKFYQINLIADTEEQTSLVLGTCSDLL